MRTINDGQLLFLPQINTGELDTRYILNANIGSLDSTFVTSGEFNALDNQYVKITGNNSVVNMNNGLNISGSRLLVRSSGIFESGVNIQGDLILNGRKVIILTEGDSFSTSNTSEII